MTTETPQSQPQPQQQRRASLDWLRPLYERELPLGLGFRLPQHRGEVVPLQYEASKASGFALSVVVEQVHSAQDLMMVKPAVRVVAVNKHTGALLPGSKSHSTAALHMNDRWNAPLWEEEFSLGPYAELCNADVVLLFELVDTKPSMRTAQKRKRNGARRLAWGYLHTVDRHGKPNVGVLDEWSATPQSSNEDLVGSVQLFAYQPDDVASRWQRIAFGLGVPPENVFHEDALAYGSAVEAYAQYRKQKRVMVDATLRIRSFPRYSGDSSDIDADAQQNDGKSQDGDAPRNSPRLNNPTSTEMRAAALKRMRGRTEPCIPPTHIAETIRAGRSGSMVVKFSHSGHLLAVGCAGPDVVKLYDTDAGAWRFECAPHHGLVYDVAWAPGDDFFASVAGDGCCLVYAFPVSSSAKEVGGAGQKTAENNPGRQFVQPVLIAALRLSSPSFLYAATFVVPPSVISRGGSKCPMIITGGADGALRLWDPSNLDEPHVGELHGKYGHTTRVNALVQDHRSGSVASADAAGAIIVWRTSNYEHPDTQSFVATRKLRHVDLLGKAVLSLSVFPSQSGSRLFVLAQPNTIKVFELTTNSALDMAYQGVTVSSTFTRACSSPDGQILACGTDEGRLMFFAQNGKALNSGLNSATFLQSIRCIHWHPTQHLVAASAYGENAPVLLLAASRSSLQSIHASPALQTDEPKSHVPSERQLDEKSVLSSTVRREDEGQGQRQARLAALTARLRLKCRFGDDIRVVIAEQQQSFERLAQQLEQDYGFAVLLRYRDDDDDLITLASQNDLDALFAMHSNAATVNVVVRQQMLPTPRKKPIASIQAANFQHNSHSSTRLPTIDSLAHAMVDKKVRWRKGELIGQGAFGSVHLGLNLETGELMAVKQMTVGDVGSRELALLTNEVAVLKKLSHQNIVRYIAADASEGMLKIFLEYVPGGSIKSLLEKFGSFEELILRNYTRQLLLGLEYLHSNGIAHRDIKGANCLVGSDGVIKLADFGASIHWRSQPGCEESEESIRGTPCWMAPEVVRDSPTGLNWKKADMWSLGCTVLEMSTAKPPWSQFDNQITILYHMTCQETLPRFPEDCSIELITFLNVCLQRTPSNRPDVTSLLLHPLVAPTSRTTALRPSTVSSKLTGAPLARQVDNESVSLELQRQGFADSANADLEQRVDNASAFDRRLPLTKMADILIPENPAPSITQIKTLQASVRASNEMLRGELDDNDDMDTPRQHSFSFAHSSSFHEHSFEDQLNNPSPFVTPTKESQHNFEPAAQQYFPQRDVISHQPWDDQSPQQRQHTTMLEQTNTNVRAPTRILEPMSPELVAPTARQRHNRQQQQQQQALHRAWSVSSVDSEPEIIGRKIELVRAVADADDSLLEDSLERDQFEFSDRRRAGDSDSRSRESYNEHRAHRLHDDSLERPDTPEAVRLTGHAAPITAICSTQQAGLVITGCVDGTVCIWKFRTMYTTPTATAKLNPRMLESKSSGIRALSASIQRGTSQSDIFMSGTMIQERGITPTTASDQRLNPQKRALHSSGRPSLTKAAPNSLSAMASDTTFDNLFLGTGSGAIVHSSKELRNFRPLVGHDGPVTCIVVDNATGDVALSSSMDKTMRLWDVRCRKPQVQLYRGHTDSVTSVLFGHDGRSVISASKDKTVRFWDIRTSRLRATATQHFGPIFDLAEVENTSSSPSVYVTAGADCMGHTWSLDGECHATMMGHRSRIAAISRYNRHGVVATGAQDSVIKIWEPSRGRCLATLTHGHGVPSAVLRLTWAATAGPEISQTASLFTGSADGAVKRWTNTTRAVSAQRARFGGSNWTSVEICQHGAAVVGVETCGDIGISSAKDGSMMRWQC